MKGCPTKLCAGRKRETGNLAADLGEVQNLAARADDLHRLELVGELEFEDRRGDR